MPYFQRLTAPIRAIMMNPVIENISCGFVAVYSAHPIRADFRMGDDNRTVRYVLSREGGTFDAVQAVVFD